MSKLTALAEYVHTWAPIATQLLASDNDAVKCMVLRFSKKWMLRNVSLKQNLEKLKLF